MSNNRGQTLVLALIAMSIIIVGVLGVLAGSVTLKQNSRYSLDSLDAANLAEAGIDKAVATLNKTAGNYNGENETPLGNGSYKVTVTPIDLVTVLVESTGFVPNAANPKSTKKVSIKVERGAGMSFAYGVQAGEGGFVLTGGSRVNGSVYSNYDVLLSGGGTITGDVYVAGGTQPIADQQFDCGANCADYEFGKVISGNSILDVAQSFKPVSTAAINKIALKLKKVGTPPNVPVFIVGDSGNKPDKNNVLASGTLNASLVTNEYGFINVGFLSNPILTAETTYWIVIDTNSNSNNYWVWHQHTLGGYTRGISSWSPNRSAGNPTWNNISGDFTFKTFMGGTINKLVGTGSSFVNGSAHANTMTGDNSSALQIGQEAYYQTQSGITVQGNSCSNNTHCHPGSTDPQPLVMPVSDANIAEWKELADDQVHNGSLNIQWPCTTTLEKKKYNGSVTVGGGCNIQIESPVWITGNLTVQSGATVRLNSSFGASSGVIVVDGATTLSGGSTLRGSGTTGSYLTILSTNTSPGGAYAIDIAGGNSSSILYAPYGIIHLGGGSNLREAVAWKIIMDGGSILTYETGVASPYFSSGPSGSYSVVKGTYQGQ